MHKATIQSESWPDGQIPVRIEPGIRGPTVGTAIDRFAQYNDERLLCQRLD